MLIVRVLSSFLFVLILSGDRDRARHYPSLFFSLG